MILLIQFLHPLFLYGLLLLAVPILLHLFSLKKYKKVYFSNFNFLAALQQQKKNSSKLKNILLLLLRLLALTCIVIAFAGPFINPGHKKIQNTESPEIVIYTDNSFSMTNSGTRGSLLEEAKKYLFNIVNTYPQGTGFRFLTNDAPNDILLTKEQMPEALGNLQISSNSKTLSQILKESNELTQGQASTLFIVSDFQKKNCDFQNIIADSTQDLIFLSIKPENLNNLYIKDARFKQPFHQKNQTDKISITVANASNREFHNIPLTLTINEKKKSISQIDIPANGEKTVEINYVNSEDGFYKGSAEISDFPVVFDNKFYFSYAINDHAEVLYLWQNQENPYFGKLFSDSTVFSFTSTSINRLGSLNLSRYNLVIADGIANSSSGLESTWEEYLINGGNLFILPDENSIAVQNRFLKKLQAPQFGQPDTNTTIARIETQAAIFREVFEQPEKSTVFPHIRKFYRLSTGNSEKLLADKQGNTLLSAKVFGKGNLYISAFSFNPENSDIVYHPLFVPLMANMAYRINSALNTSYFLNSGTAITINNLHYNDNQPLQIRKEDGSFEFIPEIRRDYSGDLILTNGNIIRDAGLYEVLQDDKVIDVLAWNDDREESQMTFCTEEELQKNFPHARIENIRTTQTDRNGTLVKEIVLQDTNKYLSPWFLLVAAIALILEQIVWKRKLN